MPLTVSVTTKAPSQAKPTLLVVPLHDNGGSDLTVPAPLRRQITAQLRALEFKAEWNRTVVFPLWRNSSPLFVAAVGLGSNTASISRQAEGMRRGLGRVVAEARKHGIPALTVSLNTAIAGELAAAALEGVELANYRFVDYTTRLKREHAARAVRKLTMVVPSALVGEVRQRIAATEQVLTGVNLARDLVNQPASAMTPRHLVEAAQAIAKQSRRLSLTVLDRAAAARAGFSAFLAVAQGSTEEPYVIHLKYTPAAAPLKKVVMVGKGVTFDSGGLSLKPAEMMETMKSDMAGAASVLGLLSIVRHLNLPVEVHGIIPACENMPSGTAYRPGDILSTKDGKTIEVLNTDAEGRITLADALTYAREQQPDVIIDLATLTGACMVGLGETIAGLWSNDETVQADLLTAAAIAGEGLCALPLPDEYLPFIQSRVADLRNLATSRYGGAITAAMFLREFVGQVPWAHLDIAGPSYSERNCLPYFSHGATGYGVRMLAQYLDIVSREAA